MREGTVVVTGVGLNIEIKLINILIIEASATNTERKRSCGVGSTEDTSETSCPLPPPGPHTRHWSSALHTPPHTPPTPILMSIPIAQILASKYHFFTKKNQGSLGKMADSRARTRKAQFRPRTPCARKQGSA